MRLTKHNIDKYIDNDGNLDLYSNKEITHIDYLPENIKYVSISRSNVEEITCKLHEGLEYFYCYRYKLSKLPLIPKSLISFDGVNSKLPKEFKVSFYGNFICNNLRKLQMINSL